MTAIHSGPLPDLETDADAPGTSLQAPGDHRRQSLADVSGGTTAASIGELLRYAIDKGGVQAAELTQLADLAIRVKKIEAEEEFARDLAAFQAECPQIKRGDTAKVATKGGGTFSYTFATLDDIDRIVKPIATRHGFSYTWDADTNDSGNMLIVRCILTHRRGHSRSSKFPLPVANEAAMSPQQKSSAAYTFAQRRTLAAVFGITTSDDDPATPEADPSPITEDQALQIEDLLKESGLSKKRLLSFAGAPSIDKIKATDYTKVVTALQATIERNKHAQAGAS